MNSSIFPTYIIASAELVDALPQLHVYDIVSVTGHAMGPLATYELLFLYR